MSKLYFTLTGLNHYYGGSFLEPGMKLKLHKEPDNAYDREAIRVELKGLGKIGYVANSAHTVLGDTFSAGRLYLALKKKAKARIVYVTDRGAICEIYDGIKKL